MAKDRTIQEALNEVHDLIYTQTTLAAKQRGETLLNQVYYLINKGYKLDHNFDGLIDKYPDPELAPEYEPAESYEFNPDSSTEFISPKVHMKSEPDEEDV